MKPEDYGIGKREIEFRAWDKGTKKMLANTGLVYPAVCLGGGIVGAIGDEMKYDMKNYVLMQYTGLLDKNGKKIFEGDIFDCIYAFCGCIDHKMVVEYNNDRGAFFPRWDYTKCHQKNVSKTMRDLTRLEVIGNVFENPNLLTK